MAIGVTLRERERRYQNSWIAAPEIRPKPLEQIEIDMPLVCHGRNKIQHLHSGNKYFIFIIQSDYITPREHGFTGVMVMHKSQKS